MRWALGRFPSCDRGEVARPDPDEGRTCTAGACRLSPVGARQPARSSTRGVVSGPSARCGAHARVLASMRPRAREGCEGVEIYFRASAMALLKLLTRSVRADQVLLPFMASQCFVFVVAMPVQVLSGMGWRGSSKRRSRWNRRRRAPLVLRCLRTPPRGT